MNLSVEQAGLFLIACLLTGLGWFVFYSLKLAPKAREEDIENMAAIRKTMRDVLLENGKLKEEITSLGKKVDELQEENLKLKILINTMENQIKDLIDNRS